MKIVIEQIENVVCNMCERCAKEFKENPENPYTLVTQYHSGRGHDPLRTHLNIERIKELVTVEIVASFAPQDEPRAMFHHIQSGSCITDEEYDFTMDCSNKGCEVGFCITVTGFMTASIPAKVSVGGTGVIEIRWWK